MKKLIVIGPFPPPRHGVSAVNEAMVDLARKEGMEVTAYNTAPSSLGTSLAVRLSRIGRLLTAWKGVFFGRGNHQAPLYMSLSGGWGLLAEIVLVMGARFRGMRLFLHHHSFRYLDAPFWPMSAIVSLAGANACHVVLGEIMKEKLTQRYPAATRALVLSNAVFVPAGASASHQGSSTGPLKVGHLANLSAAKGLDDVLAVAELCVARKLPVEFVVAGPFEHPHEKSTYEAKAAALPNVRFVGPLYGPDKMNFYASLDLFLFPTRYRNEAEPLVVLESLGQSVPVIAYGRGCIPSMVDASSGLAIPPSAAFAETAVSAMEAWIAEDHRLQPRKAAARAMYQRTRNDSERALAALLIQFKNSAA